MENIQELEQLQMNTHANSSIKRTCIESSELFNNFYKNITSTSSSNCKVQFYDDVITHK